MNTLLKEVEIYNYPSKILSSNKRRAKYYEVGKKLPKKYQNSSLYFYKQITIGNTRKTVLVQKSNLQAVLANPIAVGTPKYLPINGQAIWNGNVRTYDRAKVMKALKSFFTDYVKKLDPLPTPLHIHYLFYNDWSMYDKKDLSNHAHVYVKAFEDVLVDEKIIPEDNYEFITGYYPQYIESNENKLIIRFYGQ